MAEVPDEQTVPRAELLAAILAIAKSEPDSPLKIVVDAAYLIKGAARQKKMTQGNNGDLWELFFAVIEDREAEVKVWKIKSHTEDDANLARAKGNTPADVLGNGLADLVADKARERCKPTKAELGEVKKQTNISAIVITRLALIQARIWETKSQGGYYEIQTLDDEEDEKVDTDKGQTARVATKAAKICRKVAS